MGGRIGRGTFKPSKEAIDARALEIYNAQMAASAATVPPTVNIPENGIVPTGNLTDGAKGRGKTDAERAAEALARQKESAAQLLVSLKQKGKLEAASTEEQRRELALQFEKENLATRFPDLTEEQLKPLRDVLDENYGITEEKRKQKKLDEELAKKAKKSADRYKQLGDSIKSNITDGIIDAIEGTKTLGETALGIVKDLGRQFLRFGINQAFGALGSTGGILGKLFGGGKASGGTVQGGRSYMVGERGPELFTPGRTGSIAPNSAMGGNISVNVNVDASGSAVQGDGNESAQLGKAIGAAVQQELLKQKRPGGLLSGV